VIYQLIYTCALRAETSLSDLDKIARYMWTHTKDVDITGITICKDGSVLQVLEGDEAVVTDLFKRIIGGPRVTNPLVLIKRNSTQREFRNWSMGYKNASTDAASFELNADTLAKALPEELSPEVDTIGRTFARVNGLT